MEVQDKGKKRQYIKPEIKKVDLRPAEAVLADCKTSSTSAPGNAGSCILPTSCSTAGS